jgi:uncharacterized lipoprotein YbaY
MIADPPAGGAAASPKRTVRGEIVFPGTEVPAEASTVVVRVEDISRADAPSTVVGEQRIDHADLGRVIPFSVDVPADLVDERALYSVHAHVDISGSGEVEVGDYVSTQTHPTLTRGATDVVVVPVTKV